MPDETNGWGVWAKRVLHDLEKLEAGQRELSQKMTDLTVDIAVLKTKAANAGAAWGTIASIVVAIIASIIHFILK
jgi:hypothetical protein